MAGAAYNDESGILRANGSSGLLEALFNGFDIAGTAWNDAGAYSNSDDNFTVTNTTLNVSVKMEYDGTGDEVTITITDLGGESEALEMTLDVSGSADTLAGNSILTYTQVDDTYYIAAVQTDTTSNVFYVGFPRCVRTLDKDTDVVVYVTNFSGDNTHISGDAGYIKYLHATYWYPITVKARGLINASLGTLTKFTGFGSRDTLSKSATGDYLISIPDIFREQSYLKKVQHIYVMDAQDGLIGVLDHLFFPLASKIGVGVLTDSEITEYLGPLDTDSYSFTVLGIGTVGKGRPSRLGEGRLFGVAIQQETE